MFHMTLKWEMQLLGAPFACIFALSRRADELPMIYGSCVFVFALQKQHATSGLRGGVLVLALLLFSIGVTVSYLDHQNALFHEVSYGILVHVLPLPCTYRHAAGGGVGDPGHDVRVLAQQRAAQAVLLDEHGAIHDSLRRVER